MKKEKISSKEEKAKVRDITKEFLNKSVQELIYEFLPSVSEEESLVIDIKWNDDLTEQTTRRLKAFLEDPEALGKQKRVAIVRATKEEINGPVLSKPVCRNAFALGVKLEEIQE